MTGTIDVISFPVGCGLWNIAVLIAEEIKVVNKINDLKNAFCIESFYFLTIVQRYMLLCEICFSCRGLFAIDLIKSIITKFFINIHFYFILKIVFLLKNQDCIIVNCKISENWPAK